ncbi:Proline iminopeptidase [Tolypocladium ophioglossoides CBS 100239]|uniref:Proline iminopeptidase n=1 Tax=Tolypocladium ophioglossoides (strain CBS 100239) TaxID=1163406 RepID=A0A0L0NN12_TOLOC|nr:Proline iminopeptidase [Tolypocladium ophioglossoides CBS 100239]
MASIDIPPAKLVSSKSHVVPGQLLVTELFFQVPLDYASPSAGSITIFGRSATKRDVSIFPPEDDDVKKAAPKPYMVYLEGGPGFGNREPQDHPLTRAALPRGYQVLYLDHRGVGMSTPVSAAMLAKVGDADAQASYLRLMRQDNTVRDCEAVRKCLTDGWPAAKAPWSIFGQSYGGFVSVSYLSMHPEGLREVFLTGGLAPVGKTADQVYEATFRKTVKRNLEYFAKFPEDSEVLHQLAAYIEGKEGGRVPLPSGGTLTVPRLLTIGIAFGGHGGFDNVHSDLLHLKASLDQFGFFTRAALQPLESFTPFDTNIIYAILHEAIYCDGPGRPSNWAAYRVGKALKPFAWLSPGYSCASSSDPLLFSGEMVFPLHFQTYPELIPLRDVAEKLATATDWGTLYNEEQLRNNTVPVYAASYVEDMYVEYHLARETSKLVRGTKVFETNVMYHNGLRAKSDEVLQQLFSLRDDVLD